MAVSMISTWMAKDGGMVPDHDKAPVVAHMKGREVEITIDISRDKAQVWSCELTPGSIDINKSYFS